MDLTQKKIDILSQPIRNKRIKIELLNDDLVPINSIEGVATDGNITANANNDIRRSGNLSLAIPIDVSATTFLDNSPEDVIITASGGYWIDKLLKIYVGIDDLTSKKVNTVWYKLGVFLMDMPIRNFSASEYSISFNLADQTIKLNGERQGQLTGLGTIISAGEYQVSDTFVYNKYFPDANSSIFSSNTSGAYSCEIKPNGEEIAYLLYDGSIKIFKATNGYPEGNPYIVSDTLPTTQIFSIRYNPNGEQFIIVASGGIYIYDCTNSAPYNYLGKVVYNVPQRIESYDFNSIGSLFVVANPDDSDSPLSLYSTETIPYNFIGYLQTGGDRYRTTKCKFSIDDKHIFCSNKNYGDTISVSSLKTFSVSTMREVKLLGDDFYDKYGKLPINDFCFNANGEKFSILFREFPFLVSFNTRTSPYTQLKNADILPQKEYYYCIYDNVDNLILAGDYINNDTPILLYKSDTNPYKFANTLINSFQTEYLSKDSRVDGFALNGINIIGDIVYLCGFGYPRSTYKNDTIFSVIYDIKRNKNIFTYNYTKDAIKYVLEELANIKNYYIYDIPEQYKYLPFDIKVGTSSTVWDIIKNFKQILSSWQFYFDLDGIYRIEPIPSGKGSAIFPLDFNTYLKTQLSYDYSNVKNQMVVYGKPNSIVYYTEDKKVQDAHIVPNTTQYSSEWLASKQNIDFLETKTNMELSTGNSRIYSIEYIRSGLTDSSPKNRFIAIESNSAQIWVSDDKGFSWQSFSVLPQNNLWTKIYKTNITSDYSALIALVGSVDNEASLSYYGAYSNDSGVSWEEIEFPFAVCASDVANVGGKILIALSLNDEYSFLVSNEISGTTSDTYNSWTPLKIADSKGDRISFTHITSFYDYTPFSGGYYAVAINRSGEFAIFNKTVDDVTVVDTGLNGQNAVTIGEIIDNEGAHFIATVTVGDNGVGGISLDKGKTWNKILLPKDDYYSVKYIGQQEHNAIARNPVDGYFVAMGYKYIVTSKNGVDWNIISKDTGRYYDIAYDGENNLVSLEGDSFRPEAIIGEKNFTLIEPEKDAYYKVDAYFPPLSPTEVIKGPRYFTWDGEKYNQVDAISPSVEYSSDGVLNLYYDSEIDLSQLSIKSSLFGFMSKDTPNSVKITRLNIYSNNMKVLSGEITMFEKISNTIPVGFIEPNTIYIIRVSDAVLNDDDLINTTQPITFELYSRQQSAACVVDDNVESQFYINKGLADINYYAGTAGIEEGYKVGENYRLKINNKTEVNELQDGSLITFMANATNVYGDGLSHTIITIADASNKTIVSNARLVKPKEISDVGINQPIEEGKLTNDYLIHLIKYDAKNNQFIYLGKNPKTLLSVLSGGEYDNITSDQLAYERCSWELYTHNNMQDTIAIDIVPNYALDVNMKIPYSEKMQYPIITEGTKSFNEFYCLTKQVTYPLGESSSSSQVTALRLYDDGELS